MSCLAGHFLLAGILFCKIPYLSHKGLFFVDFKTKKGLD
jgi:hypothetical protein